MFDFSFFLIYDRSIPPKELEENLEGINWDDLAIGEVSNN